MHQRIEALPAELRNRVEQRHADGVHVVTACDLVIRRIRDLDNEIVAAQGAHRDGRLHDHVAQVVALALDSIVAFFPDAGDFKAGGDAGDQLARREGFDEVVVGTMLHARDA